jgi:Flp pilus assembly protein CpaB
VRRRARALAFLTAAVICAILAATVAGRYRSRVEARYGSLRPVVVATTELPAGQPIDPGRVQSALTVRRIPASFVPPGALTRPVDAVGEVPSAAIPSGSYVLAAQLAPPAPPRPGSPRVADGRRPLQVNIAGAQALTVGGEPPEGRRVDVVVARQAGLGSSARAYVAATGIRLVALQGPAGPGDAWSATLAVTEQQALSLIGAQSAGREIRLLPRP